MVFEGKHDQNPMGFCIFPLKQLDDLDDLDGRRLDRNALGRCRDELEWTNPKPRLVIFPHQVRFCAAAHPPPSRPPRTRPPPTAVPRTLPSTASARSQWALRDLNCECKM